MQIPAFAFSVEEATIDSIQLALKSRRVTCVSLVRQYLERIRKYNLNVKESAPINAYTEINPSVISQAMKIDMTFDQTGQLIGPLHCVPVILKDNIDSFDTTTTAGSYALLGNHPVKDSNIAYRLRSAGAIIIGKGGMDEFAWGMSGLSSRSGRIGNVYNTEMNPGGSSGGVAAAVSANFAAIGVGTDNSGSVRIPAVYNGLVGLRPTKGLLSQKGIFPMGNLDGTAGPMARTTKDLAKLLDVIAQPKQLPTRSYSSYLNKSGLRGKRIGIVHHVGKIETFNHASTDVTSAFAAMQEIMQANGSTLVEIDLPEFDNNRKDNQAGEIQDINAYLSAFPAVRKDFQDICESDRTRNFGDVKACLKFMNSVPAINTKQYQEVLAMMEKNRKYVENLMQQSQLDALVMPTSTQAAGSYDSQTVNLWQAAISSNSGLPAIDFVIGYNKDNMPIGVDMTAMSYQEGKLIEIAYAFEQLTQLRRIPVMPQAEMNLSTNTIPQINNLIAIIGKTTYDQLIKNAKPNSQDDKIITPALFRKIVAAVV